jgi:FMN-dependent NADH-azoreductase
MSKLLHIEASPRKGRSSSIAVAQAFLEAYKAANLGDEVETLDLWAADLPELDGDTINAKYRILHGQDHTAEEAAAWSAVVETVEHFTFADKYLLSVPMWNFGIPYKLKHYLDVIIQPGLSFSFSPKTGYTGLVTGKPVAVVYSRGGAYGTDSGGAQRDFQKPYLELALGFMGFTDIRPIVVEPTLAGGPEGAEKAKAAATELAAQTARAL